MKSFIASCLFALSTHATTYYIDYAGGNDANNGTSPNSPWQRQPYMAGWSGVYYHAPGDQFIFKGGVTWPRSCFQLHILQGGQDASTRDYYGADLDWYTWAAWVRPV